MATVRLGGGENHKDAVLLAEVPKSGKAEHSNVTIKCTTPAGFSQKNFPLSIKLNREEALRLIASICEALAPSRKS